MTVTVFLFAAHRDVVGQDELVVDVPEGATVESVAEQLTRRFPRLQPLLKRSRSARNEEYCDIAAPLFPGDRVAFIPPVSGG